MPELEYLERGSLTSQAWPDPRGKTEGQGKYVYQTCSALKWLRVELDASMKPRVP